MLVLFMSGFRDWLSLKQLFPAHFKKYASETIWPRQECYKRVYHTWHLKDFRMSETAAY